MFAVSGHPHSSGEITIKQVANAWLVILPYIHPMQHAIPSFDRDDLLKRGIDLAQERLGGDEVLDRIKRENEPQKNKKTHTLPAPPKISDIKEDNVYSFKTFPEVLEFLSETIK